jgi:hypothetical protein
MDLCGNKTAALAAAEARATQILSLGRDITRKEIAYNSLGDLSTMFLLFQPHWALCQQLHQPARLYPICTNQGQTADFGAPIVIV